ncbi:hypothetical protein [uncultured Helicobacter sp.]|uniref:hypothetical protein n=1 Tax=uncultured Helicobacter sp. TaxID=175537 RepID=UPI003751C440
MHCFSFLVFLEFMFLESLESTPCRSPDIAKFANPIAILTPNIFVLVFKNSRRFCIPPCILAPYVFLESSFRFLRQILLPDT